MKSIGQYTLYGGPLGLAILCGQTFSVHPHGRPLGWGCAMPPGTSCLYRSQIPAQCMHDGSDCSISPLRCNLDHTVLWYLVLRCTSALIQASNYTSNK